MLPFWGVVQTDTDAAALQIGAGKGNRISGYILPVCIVYLRRGFQVAPYVAPKRAG
jgi:hypothetical protein